MWVEFPSVRLKSRPIRDGIQFPAKFRYPHLISNGILNDLANCEKHQKIEGQYDERFIFKTVDYLPED